MTDERVAEQGAVPTGVKAWLVATRALVMVVVWRVLLAAAGGLGRVGRLVLVDARAALLVVFTAPVIAVAIKSGPAETLLAVGLWLVGSALPCRVDRARPLHHRRVQQLAGKVWDGISTRRPAGGSRQSLGRGTFAPERPLQGGRRPACGFKRID